MPKMFASSWWHASTDNTNYEFPLLAVNTQRPGGTESVNKYMSVYCYGKVKLRSINAGVVLEYENTEFYAFCADGFAQKEGDSVCRELGYPGATEITFGNSGVKNVIGFHNFTCPEGANSTDECTLTFTGNGHGCVLGITYVSCEVRVNPTDGSNRLSITALKIIATMFLIPAITSVFDI
ncbi:hypothetical protein SNE40_017223 [Patella caerulea]|uniref:SRCR domain-containing protein n=1 Tax=Patella caerulea TaxID=87958 RepID=A0AAN8JA14_PATCE